MGSLADKYRAKPATSLAEKYRVKPSLDESEQVAPPEPSVMTSGPGAAASGLLQGVSLGFADELAGASELPEELGKRIGRKLGTVAPAQTEADPLDPPGTQPYEPSLASVYRRARDKFRAQDKAGEAAHPALFKGGEVLGGLSVPLPGGGATTLGGKMAQGAANAGLLGTAIGAGKSEAEDAGGVAEDALLSGAISAPMGALGGAADYGISKLGQRFGARAGEVKAAKAADDLEKITATNKGAYGQKSAEGYRTIEKAHADVRNGYLSDADKQAARTFLNSPEGRELQAQISQNNLADAPEKLGAVRSAKDKFVNSPDEAAKATDDYFSKSTLKEDVWPRVKKYAARAIPQGVADAAGEVMGGAKGVAAGVLGTLSGAALGAPGTSLGNLMQKTPRFNHALFQALESGAEPLARAAGIAPAIWTAQTAKERLKTLQDAMEDPEIAQRVKVTLEDGSTMIIKPTLKARFGG